MSTNGIPTQERRGFKEILILSICILAFGIILTTINIIRLIVFTIHDESPASVLLLIFWLVLSVGVFIFGSIATYVIEHVSRPPPNDPSDYITNNVTLGKTATRLPTLVCLGDSLIHGTCSADIVNHIPQALKKSIQSSISINVVNAGQNAICTWTVLQERVLHTLACNPDYICLLIGTNDIRAIYKKEWAEDIIRIWGLPEQPSLDVYERNLNNIVAQLVHSKTGAHIGLCTLPPMGEDLNSRANEYVRRANDIVKNVARRFESTGKVEVLDIFYALESSIKRLPPIPGWQNGKYTSVDDFELTSIWMCVGYYVLGKSWTNLSYRVGNKVLSDSLHLNEIGRDIVVDIIAQWLIHCGLGTSKPC